jgi:arylsulfatase A
MKKLYILLLALIFSINAHAQQKPNTHILAEDMGIGDVSAYNPKGKIKTPNLD